MKELREKLRDLRDDHDLTQEQIADYLGVEQQTYSAYETGRSAFPLPVVVALADLYKVSLDYLLDVPTGYLGNTDLNRAYLDDVTLHQMLYYIQSVAPGKRPQLVDFINFLGNLE